MQPVLELKPKIILDLKLNKGDDVFDIIANQGHELTKDELKDLAKELSFACYRMGKGDDLDQAMRGVAQELEDSGWLE